MPGPGRSRPALTFSIAVGSSSRATGPPRDRPISTRTRTSRKLPFVEYFEDEVTWSIKLKVPAGTAPGKKELRCQVYYMICDAQHLQPAGGHSRSGSADVAGVRPSVGGEAGRTERRERCRIGGQRPRVAAASGTRRTRSAVRGRRPVTEATRLPGDTIGGSRRPERDRPEGSGRADSVLDRLGDRRACSRS